MNVARVCVWILGGFVFGASLCVAVRHLGLWRHGHGRLMPFHVWTIALSYDLLILSLMTRTGPLDWRALIFVPALCVGAVSLIIMLRYQRERQREHDS